MGYVNEYQCLGCIFFYACPCIKYECICIYNTDICVYAYMYTLYIYMYINNSHMYDGKLFDPMPFIWQPQSVRPNLA